jgi:hypothetical protein
MLNINCTKYAQGFLPLHLKHNYIYSKPLDLKHGTIKSMADTTNWKLEGDTAEPSNNVFIQLNPPYTTYIMII